MPRSTATRWRRVAHSDTNHRTSVTEASVGASGNHPILSSRASTSTVCGSSIGTYMSTRVLRFDGGRSDARRPIFLMTGCGGASGGKRGESEAVGERRVPGVPGERVVTVPTVMARGGCGRPRAGRRRCWALIQQNIWANSGSRTAGTASATTVRVRRWGRRARPRDGGLGGAAALAPRGRPCCGSGWSSTSPRYVARPSSDRAGSVVRPAQAS